ncbi:MAG: MBOAT family O-acyltransferase [Janthinobacterium lividum]
MLFNSYIFLFGFLPITLIGYQIAAHWHRRAVVIWLSIASLAFYGYWRPAYLILLCASILFNYTAGLLISRRIRNTIPSTVLLGTAITVNLAALCYYKYLFPLLNFVGSYQRSPWHWDNVFLPLGISFFTFTQIAYLIDLQQGDAVQQDLGSYTLFATFFPHLIAGPILHHAEIMPQFQQDRDFRLRLDDVTVGFSWFIMGLCKKVLLADRFALAADPAFAAAGSIGTLGAWVGVLSYALQLYFDFSGYSDMALGLARMFSIDFPLNFSSPYKSASIIDFWQRWHMTLTRWINSYLYNPLALAVSRRRAIRGKKISRKAMATLGGFASMIAWPTGLSLFLAGIWHGAGLQFVIFGLLHGVYLTANHAWRIRRPASAGSLLPQTRLAQAFGRAGRVLLTFAAVLLAQVFFRAESTSSALAMLAGALGLHHGRVPGIDTAAYTPGHATLLPIAVGLLIVWTLPNTQQILSRFHPALELTQADKTGGRLRFLWQPNLAWGLCLGLTLFAVLVKMENPTSFLYFQF